MDLQIIFAVVFVLFLIIFLYIKRKKIAIQKIVFPLFYLILYKSNFGIKFMNKTAEKYREWIKFYGYTAIGLGVFGLLFVSISIINMIIQLIIKPAAVQQGVAIVLPFTNIPGIGYLSFLQWIISIFILAIIHEFGHGIVARAHGMKIKSSGFAFFSIFAPILPAAFVEPDEKQLSKSPPVQQYSVYAAGPIINILFALILLLALPYVANPAKLAPFEAQITEPVGFSFKLTNDTLPASQAGLQSDMIINSFNNEPITDAVDFVYKMYYCAKPGDKINLGTSEKNYTLTAVPSPEDPERGIIGIKEFKNEKKIKPKYKISGAILYWFKDLFKWLFLLNFFVGLFNLLPLGIVDGGRIIKTLLESTIKDKKKANKLWGIISLFFIILILFGLITTYLGNPFALLK